MTIILLLLVIGAVRTAAVPAPVSKSQLIEEQLDERLKNDVPPADKIAELEELVKGQMASLIKHYRAMSPKHIEVIQKVFLIAADLEKSEEKRLALVNSFMKTANLEMGDWAAILELVNAEIAGMRTVARKTPLSGKEYFTMFTKLATSTEFLNEEPIEQAKMIWKAAKRFYSKLELDPKFSKEIQDGMPTFSIQI